MLTGLERKTKTKRTRQSKVGGITQWAEGEKGFFLLVDL